MNVQSSSNTSASSGFKPTREEISARAADLWRSYGSPSDRDEEIWFEAERQLGAEASARNPETSEPKNVTPVQAPRVETETSGTSAVAGTNGRSSRPSGSSRRRS